jgi:PEGA domain
MVARKTLGIGWTTAIVLAVLALFLIPPAFPSAQAGPTTIRASVPNPGAIVAQPHLALLPAPVASPPPASLTFPRTVLVETFTGVWCPHCPPETQALWGIDQQYNKSVVDIAELHSCAYAPGAGPCYDNYVAPDGTQTDRAVFYNICGYPDVYIDGLYGICGGYPVADLTSWYTQNISAQSMIPGNVSISDTAWLGTQSVGGRVAITSGLTGTYNEITYLMEYIGKLNVSSTGTPHDIAWVVRETLHNHPVNLVAGETTELNLTGALNASWNPSNLSVVSFVQDNSTKIVENTNFSLVSNLVSTVTSSSNAIDGENQTTIVVHVANGSSGSAVGGADVNLVASAGGTFSPASGVTLPDGSFQAVFTAPNPSSQVPDIVTARVSAQNYTADTATTAIVLYPLYPPAAPTELAVTPGVGAVTLNWTAPPTGGLGVSYTVSSAATATGPYILLASTTSTGLVDSGLSAGQTLWFEVAAKNKIGLSPESAAAEATSVAVTVVGLQASSGWWITVGSQNFTSLTGSTQAQVLFMPSGQYNYTFGTLDAAYQPTINPAAGSFEVGVTPRSLSLAFSEKFGTLEGTVDPSSATVLFNGTPIEVQQGSFSVSVKPGNYTVATTSSGYKNNSTTVDLLPGQVTTLNVQLTPLPSTPSNGNGGGNSALGGVGGSTFWIGVGLVIVVAGAVLAMVALRSRGRSKGPGSPPP